MPHPKPKRIYRLYIWFGNQRGRCVFETHRWAVLKSEAERRAESIGYPKSRWLELFDWNLT